MDVFLNDLTKYSIDHEAINKKYQNIERKVLNQLQDSFEFLHRIYIESMIYAKNQEEMSIEKKDRLDKQLTELEMERTQIEADIVIAESQYEDFKGQIASLWEENRKKEQNKIILDERKEFEDLRDLQENEMKLKLNLRIKQNLKLEEIEKKYNNYKLKDVVERSRAVFYEKIMSKITKCQVKLEEIDRCSNDLKPTQEQCESLKTLFIQQLDLYEQCANDFKEAQKQHLDYNSNKQIIDWENQLQVRESIENDLKRELQVKRHNKDQIKTKQKLQTLQKKLEENEKNIKILNEENQKEKKKLSKEASDYDKLLYERKTIKTRNKVELIKLENQKIKAHLDFYQTYQPSIDEFLTSEFEQFNKTANFNEGPDFKNLTINEESYDKIKRELKFTLEKMGVCLEEYNLKKQDCVLKKLFEKEFYQEELDFYESIKKKIEEADEMKEEQKRTKRLKNLQLDLQKRKKTYLAETFERMKALAIEKNKNIDKQIEKFTEKVQMGKEAMKYQMEKNFKQQYIGNNEEEIIRLQVETEQALQKLFGLRRKLGRLPDSSILDHKSKTLMIEVNDYNEKGMKMSDLAAKCQDFLNFLTNYK